MERNTQTQTQGETGSAERRSRNSADKATVSNLVLPLCIQCGRLEKKQKRWRRKILLARSENVGEEGNRWRAKKPGADEREEKERKGGKRKIEACESTVKARNLNSLRFTLIAVQKSRHSHRVLHGSLPLPSCCYCFWQWRCSSLSLSLSRRLFHGLADRSPSD